MSGSEIDIVQNRAKEVVRSYRTKDATEKPPDRIVHGLRGKEKRREKETRQSDVSA